MAADPGYSLQDLYGTNAPAPLPAANTQQLARTGSEAIQRRPLAPIPGTYSSVDDGQGTYVGAGQPGYELAVDQAAQPGGYSVQDLYRGQPGQSPIAPHPNDLLGFYKDAMKPLDNAAQGLEWLVNQGLKPFGGSTSAINQTLGMPSAAQATANHQTYIDQQKAQGQTPGGIGEFLGGVAGTLPLALLPGGGLTQGALGGLAMSDDHSPLGLLASAGGGAAGGKLGEFALNGLLGVAAPQIEKAQKILLDNGVKLTPGQIHGGWLKHAEDTLTSTPALGDMIRNAQRTSLESMNTAAINRSLDPIGASVPNGMAGRDAVGFARKTISDGYNEIQPKIVANVANPNFQSGIRDVITQEAPYLKGNEDELVRAISEHIANPAKANGGILSGKILQDAQTAIDGLARKYGQSTEPATQALSRALDGVSQHLDSAIQASTPAAVFAKKQALDAGYANLLRIEDAAGSAGAKQGIFTSGQLASAVKRGDSSLRDKDYASGNALMQDLSDASNAVLPSSVPDSGTGARMLLGEIPMILGFGAESNHFLGHLGGALAGAASLGLPYTKMGAPIARAMMTSRPYNTEAVRGLLQSGAPLARTIGTVATQPAASGLLSLMTRPQN
jgi:hypothetical protein